MAASSIRAFMAKALDSYLMPLPAIQVPLEVLDTYLKEGRERTQTLEPVDHRSEKGEPILIRDKF